MTNIITKLMDTFISNFKIVDVGADDYKIAPYNSDGEFPDGFIFSNNKTLKLMGVKFAYMERMGMVVSSTYIWKDKYYGIMVGNTSHANKLEIHLKTLGFSKLHSDGDITLTFPIVGLLSNEFPHLEDFQGYEVNGDEVTLTRTIHKYGKEYVHTWPSWENHKVPKGLTWDYEKDVPDEFVEFGRCSIEGYKFNTPNVLLIIFTSSSNKKHYWKDEQLRIVPKFEKINDIPMPSLLKWVIDATKYELAECTEYGYKLINDDIGDYPSTNEEFIRLRPTFKNKI